jgi:hypothetical protein
MTLLLTQKGYFRKIYWPTFKILYGMCSFMFESEFSSATKKKWSSKRINTGAQYVTLDNKFKCPSLASFFLAVPPIRRTAYTWGLLTANHLDQSLGSANQKYSATVRFKLLHSFLDTTLLRPLPPTASCTNLVHKEQFPELNRHILAF